MVGVSNIGVSCLPAGRKAAVASRGIDLNIMIAGSNGLGKTTFIRRFLGTDALKSQPFKPKPQDKYWYNEDVCNVQVSNLSMQSGDITTRMRIFEVDGIGDHLNNTSCKEVLIDLFEDGFEDYDKQLEQSVRALVRDRRIHLCFYMMEPLEDVKIADVEAMRAISKYCNLFPIIAKADLVEYSRIPRLGQSVREHLEAKGIISFEEPRYDYEAPYFIVAGKRGDSDKGDTNVPPEREYPWGILILADSIHSEFNKLQKFILEDSIISLKTEIDFLYDNYRTSKLAAHLVEEGRGEENKGTLNKLEEYRREINEIKCRIKKKKGGQDDKQ